MKRINSLIPVLVILSWSCSKSPHKSDNFNGLEDNQVRASVISLDQNLSMVKAEVLACGASLQREWENPSGLIRSFVVQPGDLNLLQDIRIFRAIARKTFNPTQGPGYLLSSVWPDDRADRIRFNNVNRLLRRDTLSLGEDIIRSVGDTLPPFALYDQDGKIITTDYFDGSVTVLNFIFTRCSIAEMCPASTLRMKKLQDLAASTKVPHVRFLSITLDPDFDSPGVLKSYALAYNLKEDTFRLGTGPKSVIDDLTRQFGIFRKKDDKLAVDHTMRTMIVNSKRQIIYQFPGSQWAAEDFLARLPEGVHQ